MRLYWQAPANLRSARRGLPCGAWGAKMSAPFVKVYGNILLSSTLWDESIEARMVFFGMLVLADFDGMIQMPLVSTLARTLNLPIGYLKRGLAVLEAPDPHSRSPEEEGRRVLRTQAGWEVTNHSKYRDMRTYAQVEGAAKRKDRRHRNREAGMSADMSGTDPGQIREDKDNKDKEKKIYVGSAPLKAPKGACVLSTLALFFWEAIPQTARARSSKSKVAAAWLAQGCEPIAAQVMAGLVGWSHVDEQFVPAAHKWLADRKWENPPPKPNSRVGYARAEGHDHSVLGRIKL